MTSCLFGLDCLVFRKRYRLSLIFSGGRSWHMTIARRSFSGLPRMDPSVRSRQATAFGQSLATPSAIKGVIVSSIKFNRSIMQKPEHYSLPHAFDPLQSARQVTGKQQSIFEKIRSYQDRQLLPLRTGLQV